ncbi:hypothetical protein [Enterobacter asburiae]|uniref:hypothetical protein n=1 Tax=Enterobacter asburiae TaxID=61645 RepID=UPI000F86560E|nr:hypothetical protein [Enterobacter asburiae]RTP87933.1 hypothetical protein EKN34_13500 [Enterobacter asburiae]
MTKQNVKMTLLATLVTGLMLSQGAMASSGSLVEFTTEVGTTTCDVSLNGGSGPAATSQKVYMGEYTPEALVSIASGSTGTVGGGTYGLTAGPAGGSPFSMSIANCVGTAIPASGSLDLVADGSSALGAGSQDLYGDATQDQGFGIALKYNVISGKPALAPASKEGYILPSNGGKIQIVKNTNAASELELNDIGAVNVSITPQLAVYGQTTAAFNAGSKVVNTVHFTVETE